MCVLLALRPPDQCELRLVQAGVQCLTQAHANINLVATVAHIGPLSDNSSPKHPSERSAFEWRLKEAVHK